MEYPGSRIPTFKSKTKE
jgi:hypothetical protein